jgi:hypothetical protein
MADSPCPDCGAELVTVVSSAPGGGELRQYCRECERRRAERDRAELKPIFRAVAGLLLYGGFLLALLAAFADYLAISGRPGFGWRQLFGAEQGFLLIAVGVLLRRGLLTMVGVFLFVLSLGADLLEVGHAPGLGWRSYAAFVCAAAMVSAGAAWRRALGRGTGPLPHRSG